MRSTSPLLVAAAACFGAVMVQGTQSADGCYSSSVGLTFNSTWNFNSMGYCAGNCFDLNMPVAATGNLTSCYCGSTLPPADTKVDSSFCSTSCPGFPSDGCGGGTTYLNLYLTGLSASVVNAASSASDTTSASSTSSTPSPTPVTSANPSVITVGGQTVTATAAASASTSAAGSSSSGGPSKAGIAAGVVVGLVAVAAMGGGIFLFLRNRQRRAVEEEYRRNAAVSSFLSNGGKHPPTSSGGASSFTDTRLDPTAMAQRRMSDGSIADNQDYSRRILKVTNA